MDRECCEEMEEAHLKVEEQLDARTQAVEDREDAAEKREASLAIRARQLDERE